MIGGRGGPCGLACFDGDVALREADAGVTVIAATVSRCAVEALVGRKVLGAVVERLCLVVEVLETGGSSLLLSQSGTESSEAASQSA